MTATRINPEHASLDLSASARTGFTVTDQAYLTVAGARFFTLAIRAANAIAANTEYEVCGLPWTDNVSVVATGSKYFVAVTYGGAVRIVSPFAMSAGSNLYIRGVSVR